MPSRALQNWSAERAAVLDEIEHAHRSVGGSGPGRRYMTQHINQAYAVFLSSQFQGFCRELHEECVNYLVAPVVSATLFPTYRNNLLFGRKLDTGNPNPGNIGSLYIGSSRTRCAPNRVNHGRAAAARSSPLAVERSLIQCQLQNRRVAIEVQRENAVFKVSAA